MKRKIMTVLLSLAVALTMMPLGAASVFAEGTDKLSTPTNVKVEVTDIQQGTLNSTMIPPVGEAAFGQMEGTIVSMKVTLDKVNGASAYFVGPVKRFSDPGSNTVSYGKALSGQMPYVLKKTGENAVFDDGGTPGPNGEKITETDKTITVEKKACVLNKESTTDFEKNECFTKDEKIGLLVKAEAEGNMRSDEVVVEFPADASSKGKTFFQDGTSTGGETKQSTETTQSTETKQKTKQDTKQTKKAKKKAKAPVVRYKKLQKKKQVVKRARLFSVSKAQGKVTYKKAGGSKYLTVNKKNGKVTVRKGTRAGTYKVKVSVTAAGNNSYKKATKKITVSIVVKK